MPFIREDFVVFGVLRQIADESEQIEHESRQRQVQLVTAGSLDETGENGAKVDPGVGLALHDLVVVGV